MKQKQSSPERIVTDVVFEGGDWETVLPAYETLARDAAKAAFAAVRITRAELSVVFADDALVQKLNRDYRDKDEPTNVLSFPLDEPAAEADSPPVLGDIILAFETIRREAERDGKPLGHHVAHLVVHGVLHLLGYDHETANEAEEMESLEVDILKTLGIANPYDPDTAPPGCDGIKEAQA